MLSAIISLEKDDFAKVDYSGVPYHQVTLSTGNYHITIIPKDAKTARQLAEAIQYAAERMEEQDDKSK